MKKVLKSIALVALCALVASCGILGGGNQNAAASGSTNGQNSGAALKSLYSQYKTDGKVDLTNMNNIISMAQLVNGIQGLKDIDDKSAFYSDFAAGLILGSNNLVTQQTSKPVTNTLSTLVSQTDLSAIAAAGLAAMAQSQQAQQASQQVQQTTQQVQQTTQQAANTAANTVTNAVNAISETTAGVTNTLSSLATIFSMFQ